MKNKPEVSLDSYQFEKKLWNEGYENIMGLDEVGRGCLAGPVVAAGVILNPDSDLTGVTDSKQIKSHKERVRLAELIKQEAVCWVVKECSPTEIDTHNILKASFLAMQKCIDVSTPQPDYLLIDGNRFPPGLIPRQCIVKGDLKSVTIGAASILAKVYRDTLMLKLHEEFPNYGWDTNVGYPTKKHYEGIKQYGITNWHRKSFKLGV